jgi:predicted transglutaminase-like cysteine proteinase
VNRLACCIAFMMMALALAPASAADAPVGFQIMCLKMPAECRGGGKSVVDASDALLKTLKAVNAQVNRSIRPRHDGAADVWSVGVSAGDCEDYVLTKRRALIRAGLPASALRIASVKTRAGEGHAILVVRTTRADLVLDNLGNALRPLSQTGYRVVAMSTADPRVWS